MKDLIRKIVTRPEFHAAWLNSLSMMENTGARKISASEDSRSVNLIILKHAAEEARHAYYLKKQIARTGASGYVDYAPESLLAPRESAAYLHLLDISVSRYLKKKLFLAGVELRYAAYLLVTYAIEVRADLLYPVYQDVLDACQSRVNVKSIIAEEEGHLEEMIVQLKKFSPEWETHAAYACGMEEKLFDRWMSALEKQVISDVTA